MSRHFFTLLSALFVISGCKPDAETVMPTLGTITESAYASGVVKAEGQYLVYPVVNGRVVSIVVQEGDTVDPGQVLLHIDDRTSSLNTNTAYAQLRLLEQNVREDGPVLSQLRSVVEQGRERLNVDSTNYARQQALWAQQIGSRNDLDQRELAYTTSRTNFDRAVKALVENRSKLRTELDVARNNVAISSAGNDDRSPRSLIHGVVYDLMIEPGELATTQKPIAVIGSAEELYLELEVDEQDIRQVKQGQTVYVTLDSYGEQAFEAKVTRIIPFMDERSRTFKVEAKFVERPPTLFPNLTAEASIVLQVKENALRIPASYVVDDAFVLTGADTRTAVKLGLRDMQFVEVVSGIDLQTRLQKP